MVRAGIADVEVHIHHDREGRNDFIERMQSFCQTLRRDHGLLREVDGRIIRVHPRKLGPGQLTAWRKMVRPKR